MLQSKDKNIKVNSGPAMPKGDALDPLIPTIVTRSQDQNLALRQVESFESRDQPKTKKRVQWYLRFRS